MKTLVPAANGAKPPLPPRTGTLTDAHGALNGHDATQPLRIVQGITVARLARRSISDAAIQRRCRPKNSSVRDQASAAAAGSYSITGNSRFSPTWVSLKNACWAS